MQLNSNNLNTRYYSAVLKERQNSSVFKKGVKENEAPLLKDSLSFTGSREELGEAAIDALKRASAKYKDDLLAAGNLSIAQKAKNGLSGFFDAAKTKTVKFFRENFTDGIDVTYDHRREILANLKANFGETFEDCFNDIDNFNSAISSPMTGKFADFIHTTFRTTRGKKDRFVYSVNEADDLITFHKDPFFKNVCSNIKEFTVGQILDGCIILRDKWRKINAHVGANEVIASTSKRGKFFNDILDRRISETAAMDSFYKIAGVFEKATEGLDAIGKSKVTKNAEQIGVETGEKIASNIRNLAKDSIDRASRKVGKYNTKTERAWNRLGTGFVSALFATTDFYNISMLQNNDTEKAKASGKKRFMQDMRRQGLTAGITYIVLGAFQNKVNKSMMYAVLSLGGVTLISEILSRVMGGISLKPLTPEQAKKIAEKKESKKAKEEETAPKDNKEEIKQNTPASSENNGEKDVFSVFTDKIDTPQATGATSFTSNNNKKQINQDNNGTKKKSSVLSKILKFALGGIAASLAVGFLRTRNIGGIDTAIKSLSAKYNDVAEKLTRKRLILPKDDVEGFLTYLSKNNFNEQHATLKEALEFATKHGTMSGQSPIVQKYMPKKEINPTGFYYDMGYVESRFAKTAFNVVTYPFNTVNKLLQKGNNLVKGMFGIKHPDAVETASKLDRDVAVSFIQKYSTKYRNALNKNEMYNFKKDMEDAFTRHFSEANSKNKNTSIAMMSRFLITLISGYFFVNDYRNEVLIESKGQDIERANSTAKERVGHKVANFFLNSMFMDIFNTTFEPLYLSSVAGATAVAMATEFTNETAVRASICTPTTKMTREELIEYEDKRLNDDSLKGDYYRGFMKLTGKKPLSEKAKK